MKKLLILATVLGLFSMSSIAEDSYSGSNKQFSGQRPYMKAPTQDNTYRADDQWEGTGIVSDGLAGSDSSANTQHKQLRLNFLGKRPYMEDYPK